MPNHVRNEIEITCATKTMAKKVMEAIANLGENDDGCNRRRGYGTLDFGRVVPDESNESNWYYWRVEHWGTKWNAYSVELVDWDMICFETAWAAPIPFMTKLSKLFPSVVFVHSYASEDYGYECGRLKWKNGHYTNTTDFERGSDEATRFACELWGEDYDELMEEWRA